MATKKQKTISKNISKVMKEKKYPREQAIAIGISKAEKELKKKRKK